jgi:hypothetical protein
VQQLGLALIALAFSLLCSRPHAAALILNVALHHQLLADSTHDGGALAAGGGGQVQQVAALLWQSIEAEVNVAHTDGLQQDG